MKLPIVAYGDPVLKKKAVDITADYPELNKLIGDMFETMYNASGVGLAAPQIGLSIRLFVIDITDKEEPGLEDFKKVFINAQILDEQGSLWDFNEGCLSIPDVREDIKRLDTIRISYYDENWQHYEETYTGLPARVIQHEYDHIEGKLFTDKLSPLRRAMIKSRLDAISRGAIKVAYKMKFPAASKKR
ncbi:peptide deformylase [Arcticibacter tournemirensis]|uniref:Peptide deformylase n=1 Tax=Arcticibacter tournemirensis TaxID=699437 RepID=A0A5M9GXP1_9SPHI|nr:peptide deformylase [Arcticibacter tournemirensis]KAA8477588.1 peptide deformylase [Arcticibacter tournemirensis]TQM48391.1 peptide deformylase [Arcticibacter tournemirensis]